MTMATRQYQVRFLTPAFLGNADQNGQWRTPPFKAQLRQWWRVAVAADEKFNVPSIRDREARLFGVAADKEGDSRQSQIRLRLDRWDTGKLADWGGADNHKVKHPEVPSPVGAQLYMGYGPLMFARGATALKKNCAIQAGESALLKLAFPPEDTKALETALGLMNLYGTVGGRSRNGWGSYTLTPLEGAPALPTALPAKLTTTLGKALDRDWPHAVGQDSSGPLLWRVATFIDSKPGANDAWRLAMQALAGAKIALRTQFKFQSGKNAAQPEARHWLSYPITNHSVARWGNNARLPNSLRFKLRPLEDGGIEAIALHLPCLPPAAFSPNKAEVERVWMAVYSNLDTIQNLPRIPA